MADVANITFKADTSQVKTAAADLDKLAKSGEGVTKATDQMPAKIGAAGKAFDSIKKNATGLSFQLQDVAVQAQMGTNNLTILAQQGPQIASLFGPVGAVTGVVIGLGAALAGPMLTALGSVGDESESVADRISQLVKELDDLENAARDVKLFAITDQLFSTGEEIDSATKKLGDLKAALEADISGDVLISEESWKKRTKAIQDQQLVVDLLAAKYDRYNDEADRTVKGLNAEKPARDKATRSITQQISASEKLLETLKRSNDTFGMSRAEIIRYNAAVAASEAPSEALGLSILAEAEALAEKTENLEQATIAQKAMDEAAAESERVADKMQREYERAFESMSDSITDIIMDFKDMGSVATGIATQIARAFIQNQVVNPLLGAAGMQGAPSISSPLGSLPVGNLANTFAMSSMGQSLGLSSLGGAQLASQYGLTTGVAGASSGLTGAGSLFTSAMPWLAGGLGVIGALAGMFKKPSDKTQSQALNLATGGLTYSGLTDHKFSQQNLDAATAMSSEISALVSVMQSATGTKLTGGVQSTVGGRDGLRVLYSQLGIDTSLSKDMNEAAADFVISGGDATSVLQQTADQFARITGFDLEPYRSLISSTENIGSNLMAVDQASVFLGKSLDDIRLIFEANTVEGETLAATLQRVVSGVSAAQDEFMGFAYETLGAISNLSGLSESIRDRLLTDEELYDKLEIKAESLAKTIEDMTDPQSITAAVNEIGAIVNRQAGLLDDTQFAEMGANMAVFLDNVEAAALARTQELVDAKNAELLSMENLTNSSENIAVAAVTFGDHVSRFGEMVSAMQSLISSMSMGREAVTYDS